MSVCPFKVTASVDISKLIIRRGSYIAIGSLVVAAVVFLWSADVRAEDESPKKSGGSKFKILGVRKEKGHPFDAVKFKNWMKEFHPNEAAFLEETPPQAVVNVAKDKSQSISSLLAATDVPHMNVPLSKLTPEIIGRSRVLILDNLVLLNESIEPYLRAFVGRGGYLVLIDWSLCSGGKGFSEYMAWKGHEVEVDQVVDYELTAADDKLCLGCPKKGDYKLVSSAQSIGFVNPGKTKLLAVSKEFAKQDPSKQGILVLVVPYGKGKVIQSLGHADLPQTGSEELIPDLDSSMGISPRHAFLLNFVLEGLHTKMAM